MLDNEVKELITLLENNKILSADYVFNNVKGIIKISKKDNNLYNLEIFFVNNEFTFCTLQKNRIIDFLKRHNIRNWEVHNGE